MSNADSRMYAYRGISIELPDAIATPPVHAALTGGYYETPEADELNALLEDGEVVLEIGAGIGLISTLAAKDPRTRSVAAVEANPALIPVLRRTHALNDVNVATYNEVLGPRDGTAELHLYPEFWSSTIIRPADGATVSVPATRLQTRLDEIRPTFIILDIEGAERDIFDGADLQGVRKIMMELHQDLIGRAGVRKIFETLAAKDFAYDQHHSSRAIVTFSSVSR
jgi:FkbM family methyltransferase